MGAPGPVALAHPLGNFTVNRYARVEVAPPGGAGPERAAGGAGQQTGAPDGASSGAPGVEGREGALRLRYVVDLAEIPTFQALPTIDVNGDGVVSPAEGEAFARRTVEGSLPNLALTVDGRPVPLRIVSSEVSFLPGQAGLQTALVGAWLEAPGAGTLRRGHHRRAGGGAA